MKSRPSLPVKSMDPSFDGAVEKEHYRERRTDFHSWTNNKFSWENGEPFNSDPVSLFSFEPPTCYSQPRFLIGPDPEQEHFSDKVSWP
ncbi:hypothetical protein LH53_01060 [Mesotoga sp. TolDC]|nr:hypothetical protein LH53_01060 [Mesotoga sp. TolDC]